jgi:hypothetical protein
LFYDYLRSSTMRIAAKLDRRALMDWCASNAADVDAALKTAGAGSAAD